MPDPKNMTAATESGQRPSLVALAALTAKRRRRRLVILVVTLAIVVALLVVKTAAERMIARELVAAVARSGRGRLSVGKVRLFARWPLTVMDARFTTVGGVEAATCDQVHVGLRWRGFHPFVRTIRFDRLSVDVDALTRLPLSADAPRSIPRETRHVAALFLQTVGEAPAAPGGGVAPAWVRTPRIECWDANVSFTLPPASEDETRPSPASVKGDVIIERGRTLASLLPPEVVPFLEPADAPDVVPSAPEIAYDAPGAAALARVLRQVQHVLLDASFNVHVEAYGQSYPLTGTVFLDGDRVRLGDCACEGTVLAADVNADVALTRYPLAVSIEGEGRMTGDCRLAAVLLPRIARVIRQLKELKFRFDLTSEAHVLSEQAKALAIRTAEGQIGAKARFDKTSASPQQAVGAGYALEAGVLPLTLATRLRRDGRGPWQGDGVINYGFADVPFALDAQAPGEWMLVAVLAPPGLTIKTVTMSGVPGLPKTVLSGEISEDFAINVVSCRTVMPDLKRLLKGWPGQ